jgi:hypothetical protein
MNNRNNTIVKNTQRWQDWLTLLIGIWLFITPWIFGFSHTDFAWSPFIMGALVFLFSIWALVNRKVAEETINLIIGIWVFISPWVLGFSHTANAAWIMFVFGAILIVVDIWGIGITKKVTHEPDNFSTLQSS